ncbi:hypothetical protein Hanom_Chr09g00834741 [Helianthus anomalus]
MESVAGNRGVFCIIPPSSIGRNHSSSRGVDDNNGGVTKLSANVLAQAFPTDWKGRCTIVYQRLRRDRSSVISADMSASVTGDGRSENPWIVDPHPLAWYGEVLHTPLDVLDMFPGV